VEYKVGACLNPDSEEGVVHAVGMNLFIEFIGLLVGRAVRGLSRLHRLHRVRLKNL
jgi:hypothetical protein